MVILLIISSVLSLGLIPLTRYLNRQRGMGKDNPKKKFNKHQVFLIYSAVYTILFAPIIYLAWGIWWLIPLFFILNLIVSEYGLWIHGWGKWFPHADLDTSKESEGFDGDYIIDPLAEKIVGYKLENVQDSPEKRIKYKQVGMSLRFVVWSVPRYIFRSIITLNPAQLLAIPAMWINGHLYKKAFSKPETTEYSRGHHAELAVGASVGVIDSVVIILTSIIMAI